MLAHISSSAIRRSHTGKQVMVATNRHSGILGAFSLLVMKHHSTKGIAGLLPGRPGLRHPSGRGLFILIADRVCCTHLPRGLQHPPGKGSAAPTCHPPEYFNGTSNSTPGCKRFFFCCKSPFLVCPIMLYGAAGAVWPVPVPCHITVLLIVFVVLDFRRDIIISLLLMPLHYYLFLLCCCCSFCYFC